MAQSAHLSLAFDGRCFPTMSAGRERKRHESEHAVELLSGVLCQSWTSGFFLFDWWYARAGLADGVLSRRDCTWLALCQQAFHGDTVQLSLVQLILFSQLLTSPHTEQWRRLEQAFL